MLLIKISISNTIHMIESLKSIFELKLNHRLIFGFQHILRFEVSRQNKFRDYINVEISFIVTV